MNNEDPAYRKIEKSSLFSADWYFARNPDVAQAGLNPLQHYLRYGAAEGRDPGPQFCTRAYLERYPDVAVSGMNPLLHYVRHGIREGRNPRPHTLDENVEKLSEIIRKSDLFDSSWYLEQYPSMAEEKTDPVLDYLRKGYREGRDAGPEFDTRFYLTEYQDVADSGTNPLVHYLLHGRNEGRLPREVRARTLENKLWGGFSRYGIKELESLKSNPDAMDFEKIAAAWSLLVWFSAQGEYARALENFVFACQVRGKLKDSKKWAIPAAGCMVKLGHFNAARDLLDGILGKDGFYPDTCLAMANIAPLQAAPAGFPDADAFRLHWINRVFDNRGLTALQKRDSARGLALDNLMATVPSRSTDRRPGKISIIMPAYNAASTLALAMESILCQTWDDIELIVVDDCSTDDTFEIAQRYAALDPRVTAAGQPRNMGAYAARNAGVRLCSGDFITVHDCDDWSHPKKLESQMVPLLKDARLLGSFSFWVKVDWEMNIVGGWRPWGNLIEFNESSFLFRRALLDSLGEWDEVRVAGDREFIWRAEAKHGKDAFVHVCQDAPLSFSLTSQTSLTQAANTHVKTVFYGLRRTYREAAQWWHKKDKKALNLLNEEKRRPFPVSEAILNSPSSNPVSYVLVSDFSREALASDARPAEVLETVSQLGQAALFHWPNYSLDEDSPKDDRIFEIVANNNARLLVPGETIDTEAVLIIRPEPLEWLPDSIPTFRCQSVFTIDDHDHGGEPDAPLKDAIRLNIESVFGHSPVCLPFAIVQDYFEILESGLFSKDWYLNQYQDVAAANQDPLEHYLLYGVSEGRDPGPDFSTSGYLARYHDVAEAGINPLLHYIRDGKKEGRLTTPCLDPHAIKRPYGNFAKYLSYSMLDPLVTAPFARLDRDNFRLMDQVARWLCLKQKECKEPPLLSVIMPMRDRADFVGHSVRSVLAQSHENFELIVVDDRSRDDSVAVVRSFTDPRIRLLESVQSSGVSAARNRGLASAQGDLIAYLDSDNSWRPDYLKSMAGFFQVQPDANAAYSGQYLYRGCESEPFAVRFGCYNPSLLCNRNYIDLNCFVHRREIVDTIGGGFCEKLKRWVDWELILRISRDGKVYSVPILQSNYFLDKAENTITATEEMLPARDFILAKMGYGGRGGLQRCEDQLTRKVAVIVVGDEGQESLGKCIESLEEYSCNPLIEVLVAANSSDPESLFVKTIATEPGCDLFHAINQALHVADPESDVLILNRNAALTQCALPALQKAAYTCDSIAMVAPQQVLPGGVPSINTHVPYAFNDVPCDVTLSNHHNNIEALPLFFSGGTIDLNFASFFCLYIKREIWDECSILGNEKGGDGQTNRIICDFVCHVLGKRIVYTPDAVVFRR